MYCYLLFRKISVGCRGGLKQKILTRRYRILSIRRISENVPDLDMGSESMTPLNITQS